MFKYILSFRIIRYADGRRLLQLPAVPLRKDLANPSIPPLEGF